MAIKFYKLMDLLNKENIGKEELRKRTNISSSTMAKIAKNEDVSLKIINKICAALNCQPGEIMEYIQDTAPTKNNGATEVINKIQEKTELTQEEMSTLYKQYKAENPRKKGEDDLDYSNRMYTEFMANLEHIEAKYRKPMHN